MGPAEKRSADPQPQTSCGGEAKRDNDDKVDLTRIFFFFSRLNTRTRPLTHTRTSCGYALYCVRVLNLISRTVCQTTGPTGGTRKVTSSPTGGTWLKKRENRTARSPVKSDDRKTPGHRLPVDCARKLFSPRLGRSCRLKTNPHGAGRAGSLPLSTRPAQRPISTTADSAEGPT